MKNLKFNYLPDTLLLLLLLFTLYRCSPDNGSSYDRIMKTIEGIRVINTHEHQRNFREYGGQNQGFYKLLSTSYLRADMRSAGGPDFDFNALDTMGPDLLWDRYGEALNHTRNTSYYSHFVKGFQKLYHFDDLYFTKENIESLSGMIKEKYEDYETWFEQAFKKTGFELMILDQHWDPYNYEVDGRFFVPAFHINSLVRDAGRRSVNSTGGRSVYTCAEEEGYRIQDLDDYLDFCDHFFQKNLEHHAVCVKNSLAYFRSLDFEDVPYQTASALFERPSTSLSREEVKMLEDFMFHWIIRKSTEYGLPIQIHTGYLAGNGNVLENGKPVRLNNLFLQYPDARFILFHGGYPWTGEFAALGKMFPNVYLDLVWLPQISRETAVRSLDEMLDCVPYNKFFWGGDCHCIEESTGSLEFGKDVVAEVLSRRIQRGLMTEELACKIATGIFRRNAIEVFRLDEKLGISF